MKRISLSLLASAATLALLLPAQAADLLIQQPSMPGYIDMGGGGWDGAYIGGFVGYGWGTATDDTSNLGLPSDELDASGWLIGANLGANFTVGSGLVLGAVGDIAWSGINGYDAGSDVDLDINWMGSLRGRAGFDAGAFMPYLTGGLAIAGATIDDSGDESTQMHFGWTGGAGVEVAVTDNLSIDLLYRYTDYGSATYALTPDSDVSLTTHTVSAGLNFKF
ncbi:MAG: porin family protein [Devosia sp.]|nr:porin family protein [Devosia sp.]